jgi:hypothetical protein
VAPAGRQRRLRRIAITIAGLLALAVTGVLLLHTPQARRFAFVQLARVLASQDVDFRAAAFRYDLTTGVVELRDASFRSLRAPDAPPFLTLSSARVNLRVLALVRRHVVIDAAILDGVEIHVRVDEDGRSNLPFEDEVRAPDDGGDAAFDVRVADMQVRRARVRYEDASRQLDVTMPVGELVVDGSELTGRHDVILAAGPGAIRLGERAADVDRIEARVEIGRDDVVIAGALVEALESRLEVRGTFGPFDDPVLDVEVAGRLDAARVGDAARVDEALAGTIVVDLAVTGSAARPTVRGMVEGEGLTARGLAPADVRLEGLYDTAAAGGAIETLALVAPGGTTDAPGRTRADGETPLAALLRAVDAGVLRQIIGLP